MIQIKQSKPDSGEIAAAYQRAAILEGGVAFNTTLFPHWIGESNCFWYVRETCHGQTFRRFNAEMGTNEAAFDHTRVAKALSIGSGEAVQPDNLPLTDLDLIYGPERIQFSAFGQRWCFISSEQSCEKVDTFPKQWKISPDGKKALFTRDHNLWVRDLDSEKEKALTADGERFYCYASTSSVYGRKELETLEALWSPDSQRVLTQVIDTRDVTIGPPLIQHVPTDGSLRPKPLECVGFSDAQRRVGFSGDDTIETYQFLSIDVDTGRVQHADHAPCPVAYPPYAGYFTGRRGWWHSDSRYAYFIDQSMGAKQLRLLKFDTWSGQCEILIEEYSDGLVTLIPISHIHTLIMPLPDTNELIWYSERSGQAHLYLYELTSGQLKHPMTQGDWVVRNVLHFDADRRELFIQTAGRVAERNPYYCDIARVNIDTAELTTLLSTDHEYIVCDQRSRITYGDQNASGVSPSGQYVVTTRSRVDEVPVSLLLGRDGHEIQVLETADVSGLPEHCHWPEPVMLKAADGKTDIYGVVFRPSNFDEKKRYPVLDCSYSYASPVGAFTNNHISSTYLSAWAYAELGFIAVMIFNRGNEGLRDTDFAAYQEPILQPDPSQMDMLNKADSVAGITQLAERYPYIDLKRVGAVEFGSIPLAVAGLLIHPEFYHVGVSHTAIVDWRLMGAFHMRVNDLQLPDFADRLQGKLLIIAGMLDDCVPIAITFRLVEALKNANKRFDMLILPNLSHGKTGYTIQRSWDYVVEHLLGVEPPKDFKLVSGIDAFSADLGNRPN